MPARRFVPLLALAILVSSGAKAELNVGPGAVLCPPEGCPYTGPRDFLPLSEAQRKWLERAMREPAVEPKVKKPPLSAEEYRNQAEHDRLQEDMLRLEGHILHLERGILLQHDLFGN